MSSIATSPRHRAASPPRRSRSSPQARQTRRSRRRDHKRRRRQTRKARTARRQLQHIHQQLPQPARSLFDALAGAFTRPSFLRFLVLALASLLTIGRRTVCNLLRTLGALAPGHPSSYHRIFSQRRWSSWRLGAAWPDGSSTISYLKAPSFWRATTPSMGTKAPRSSARAATVTRSAPRTPSPCSAGGTSGSC